MAKKVIACGRCGLSNLLPGSSHADAEACIAALRDVIDSKAVCACGAEITKCPTCFTKDYLQTTGGKFVREKVGPTLLEKLAQALAPEAPK